MTVLTGPGEGPSFPYAGSPMHVLAAYDDRPGGFAAAELAVPPDPVRMRDIYAAHASRLLP